MDDKDDHQMQVASGFFMLILGRGLGKYVAVLRMEIPIQKPPRARGFLFVKII
ncbi:MAG: hypothetical protein WC915_03990 [archaeon]|jgi:hypothetical protein